MLQWLMTSDDAAQKTPGQKLAEILAKRKAAGPQRGGAPVAGDRAAERAAAARSASKSKPALRKG